MRWPKLRRLRNPVRKFSRANNYQRDIIISRARETPSAPRGNTETTRDRRSRKAPIKGHRLAVNYGEIAAKFVVCIPLENFAVPPRPLHALTITYESPLPHHSRPTFLSAFYCRIRGCVIASRPLLKRERSHFITPF